MTTIPTAASALASLDAPTQPSQRAQLAEAAKQFEAIFVRQMLAAARKTDFGGDLFGGQAIGTFRQMQDDHFADVTAQTGALGMAKIIEAQLARFLPAENGPASSADAAGEA